MPHDLSKFHKIIGHNFKDSDLLEKALTHKSYAAEIGNNEHNERLEFLGDSILSIIVAEYLYQRYPSQDEGRLSQLKSQIVSRQNLSNWSKKIKLGNYIYISKGEEANGGRKRESLLSNAFEALIAAIYIDGGLSSARQFILSFLNLQRRLVVNDAKSKLQENIQALYRTLPEYKVMKETGPDHDKVFEIGVYLKKNLLGRGIGHSKKEAEQVAAKNALKTLGGVVKLK